METVEGRDLAFHQGGVKPKDQQADGKDFPWAPGAVQGGAGSSGVVNAFPQSALGSFGSAVTPQAATEHQKRFEEGWKMLLPRPQSQCKQT